MHGLRVEPHPLDSDWRFTARSAAVIAALIPAGQRCLILGAPSVAILLERAGAHALLVDRQPLQSVRHHLLLDASLDAPPSCAPFDVAVTDPPWYPEVFERWLGWVAGRLHNTARILCTLWPTNTRPEAEAERSRLMDWLADWADVEVHARALTYETPAFEAHSATALSSDSPRRGDLMIIRKRKHVPLPPALPARELWHRFVFDEHQIAIRVRDDSEPSSIELHPLAQGWNWPSVSRRAEGRSLIDLWSSCAVTTA